jgi:hypothetical protein
LRLAAMWGRPLAGAPSGPGPLDPLFDVFHDKFFL